MFSSMSASLELEGRSAALVVSRNLVFGGTSGSLSAAGGHQAWRHVFGGGTGCVHCLRLVSRIMMSMSQFPTPGPPLRERDGSTRLRVCIPDFVIGWAVVAIGASGVRDAGVSLTVFVAARLPMAFADGAGVGCEESVMTVVGVNRA